MPWFESKLEGLPEAVAAFERVGRTFGPAGIQEVRDELLECAEFTATWAKSFVRVRSGRLERAIQAGLFRNRSLAASFVRVDYKKAPHAHLVEYGTRHSAARPYFKKAEEVAGPLILARLERKAAGMLNRSGCE